MERTGGPLERSDLRQLMLRETTKLNSGPCPGLFERRRLDSLFNQ